MDTIATRIMQVVEESGGNMSDFARNIDVTPAYISKLKNKPDSVPSTDVIKRICDKYNIREQWIRTGDGPMRLPEPEEDLDYINDLLSGDSGEVVRFVHRFLRTYRELTPDRQKVMQDFIKSLSEK